MILHDEGSGEEEAGGEMQKRGGSGKEESGGEMRRRGGIGCRGKRDWAVEEFKEKE